LPRESKIDLGNEGGSPTFCIYEKKPTLTSSIIHQTTGKVLSEKVMNFLKKAEIVCYEAEI